ncbi:hypothetical protein [Cohnella sp. GCM10012308]|uniref:hypothetical protein n=1 Tax=Cohnella sp. GCM10012308 TaxID=3317329 RepID=UPI00361F1EC7
MDKQGIIARLLALPAEIARAEIIVIESSQAVLEAKAALQEREAELLTSPANPIDGKNETIRSAQLRSFTTEQREWLTAREYDQVRARATLSALHTEMSALRSIADLLREAN